eukprot:486287_1
MLKRLNHINLNHFSIKAIWGQRKIFSPLLVYFYDTATDIAVVIFYYEMTHDDNDYRVINPTFLFRSSLAVLIWNKVVIVDPHRRGTQWFMKRVTKTQNIPTRRGTIRSKQPRKGEQAPS